MPAVPAVQFGEAVRTHDPNEAAPFQHRLHSFQRVGSAFYTRLLFNIGYFHLRVGDQFASFAETFGEICGVIPALEPVLGRNKPPDLVQPQLTERRIGDGKMTIMGRIEGASIKTDPLPWRE